MDETRALLLLSDIVDAVLRKFPAPLEAVKVLEDYGFEPEELVENFDIPVEYVPNYKTEEDSFTNFTANLDEEEEEE